MSFERLTRNDLDEIAHSLSSTSDPFAVAQRLLDVVDRGQIADRAEISYALLLAAEVYQRSGDLETAEAIATRAVTAHQQYGDRAQSFPQAYRAGLRLRLGQEDLALAELSSLRPRMAVDPSAIAHITEALEDGGHADLAERWVTQSLEVALSQQPASGTAEDDAAAFAVYTLAQRRSQLRSSLGLPGDALDQLADQLRAGLGQALAEEDSGEDSDDGTAVLFWPQMDFERLIGIRPILTASFGRDWDQHRMMVEWGLVRLTECGKNELAVLVGSVDDLLDYSRRIGGDPADPVVRDGYIDESGDRLPEIEWPPGRNGPCWCGSGLAYRSCCQRRPPES